MYKMQKEAVASDATDTLGSDHDDDDVDNDDDDQRVKLHRQGNNCHIRFLRRYAEARQRPTGRLQ